MCVCAQVHVSLLLFMVLWHSKDTINSEKIIMRIEISIQSISLSHSFNSWWCRRAHICKQSKVRMRCGEDDDRHLTNRSGILCSRWSRGDQTLRQSAIWHLTTEFTFAIIVLTELSDFIINSLSAINGDLRMTQLTHTSPWTHKQFPSISGGSTRKHRN